MPTKTRDCGGWGGFYTFNKVGVRKERGSEKEVMV